MKHVSKLFLVGMLFCMQLHIIDAAKQRRKTGASTSAATSVSAFSTTNLGSGTDNTYREKLKRAVDVINTINSGNFYSKKTSLDTFVTNAVSIGADDEITGLGNKEQNQIYDKSPVFDEVSLVELGRTLYFKVSFNPAEATRYVVEIFGGILTAQQTKIPTTYFGTYLTNMAQQVILKIPAYHMNLKSYVQSFIDAAKAKAGTNSEKNNDLQSFVSTINPYFSNQLQFESPGAAVATLINKLNKSMLSASNYRTHLYTFATTVLTPLNQATYNQIRTNIESFVSAAIEKGKSDSISSDKNKVFLVDSQTGNSSLVDLATKLYEKQYIMGNQHTINIFTQILETQAIALPGTRGSKSTYISKLERLSTHVIQRIPSNLKASLKPIVDQFLRSAKAKTTTGRTPTLTMIANNLQSLGFSSIGYNQL